MKNNKKSGFTLVELAIVLVIIGLIVGGVLVGQDLIKAATVRAAVSQLEKYDTAANTFRNKYNALPGDLTTPVNFFSTIANSTVANLGDGDGLIEDVSATTGTLCTTEICLGGEAMVAWTELNLAGLIPDGVTANTVLANVTPTPGDTTLPQSKLGRGARVAFSARSGRNFYVIGNPGTAVAVAGDVTWTAGISPIDAYNVDTKMDDGAPALGKVMAAATATPAAGTAGGGALTAAVAATTCYDSTTAGGVYLTTLVNTQTNTDLIVCNLSVRTSF
ncbi:MAG: type II secretion system protein [Pseudomonadota bacterium]